MKNPEKTRSPGPVPASSLPLWMSANNRVLGWASGLDKGGLGWASRLDGDGLGGDPIGTGKGSTSIWGKKFNDEIRESLKHNARGIMSMANSGANTNGSQFFMTYAKQPHLNGLYTVFGKVIHGFEVLDHMEKT
ncbi:Peptidyl-prolyl cis-trans isomerase CYP18-1 [Bienertia sinuspersici]